jgi:RNA polymerase sigma-70 factor (sigma-E family)
MTPTDAYAGDGDEAFSAFVTLHYRRLVGVLAFGSDVASAEELAQDALVRLYERWSEVSTMAAPWGWLCTVALNLQRSSWRRALAHRRALHRHGVPREEGDAPEQDEVLAIRAAVVSLPMRQRHVVILRFYAQLSVAETAEQLGIAQGTVKSLTNRAVASLRSSFSLEIEEVARG